MARRLIVPLDQSAVSECALPLARGLVRQLELPVSLITVIDAPSGLMWSESTAPPATSPSGTGDVFVNPLQPTGAGASSPSLSSAELERLADSVAAGNRYLERVADTFDGFAGELEVLYGGDPADRILSFAETRDEPFLVMATRGRTGIQRALLGSVTSRVVQASPFPIFVARGTDPPPEDVERTIEKVLVPLDGSRFAEHALTMVKRVFGAHRLQIVLLQTVETQRARGAYEFSSNEQFTQTARREAETYLEDQAAQLRSRGFHVICDMSEGRVAECINGSANTYDVDLIAMATHGSSAGMRRFVLGSVAEQVLHEAEHPLLVIRPST